MSSDLGDLSQFLVSEGPQPKSSQQPGGVDLSQFLIDGGRLDDEQESGVMTVARNIARSGLSGAAAIGAMPGQFVQAVKAGAEALPQGPDFLRRKPSFLQKGAKAALEALPTEEQLKEPSRKIAKAIGFEGFFDAKGSGEEFLDEIVADFTVLAMPARTGWSVARALGTAIASNITGEVTEKVTGSKKAGALAKIGTMFVGGFLGRKSAREYSEGLLQQVENDITGVRVNSVGFKRGLSDIEKRLGKGLNIPEKAPVKRVIRQLKKKSAPLTVEAEELWNSRKDINRRITNKAIDAIAKRDLALVKEEIDKALKQIDRIKPGFSKTLDDAVDSFAAIKKGEGAAEFISKQLVKAKNASPETLALLALAPAGKVATVAGVAAASTGLQAANRILTVPSLRPHYINLLKAAAAENTAATARAIERFDKEVKKAKKRGDL